MAGSGPSADAAGNIYVVTGNGTFNANTTGGKSYSDSVIKFAPDLTIADYFTPFNQADLNSGDVDLGSSGFVLFADQSGDTPHIGVVAGKEGRIYILNRDTYGKI